MIEAAGLIIQCFKTGRVLFLRRGPGSDFPGYWCTPGGRLEYGETPEEAALRETLEEAGPCPFGNPKFLRRDSGGEVLYTTFYAKCVDEFTAHLNEEHTAWAWALPDDPPMPLHPGCAATLRVLIGEPETTPAVWDHEASEKIGAALVEAMRLAERVNAGG